MTTEAPLVLLIATGMLGAMWLSNVVYDKGTPHYISRKIGHAAGGFAFAAAPLFSSPVTPILLAAAFGVLLLGARRIRPQTFRGVGGTGRSGRVMAEVWFAWVAVPVFFVSWMWLDQPAIAIAALLYMAWGDGITGLVRSQVYHRPVKGLWGSLAMLLVCLAISLVFVKPFWMGAVASMAAVVTERFCGDNGSVKCVDGNLAIPIVGMVTLLGLTALTGNL